MGTARKIKKVFKSKPTLEGAGVHLKRAFGNAQVPLLDPFLLLDDFHSNKPEDYIKGFPWHPHRGIETITYMLHGRIEHGDSLGNKGTILPGQVQWMTAGNGIIHQEMPQGEGGGRMWGFQLWANLPASHKMMMPRYREVRKEDIPVVELKNGIRASLISGSFEGNRGPVKDVVIEPQFWDVWIPPKTTFTHSVVSGHTVMAYVIEGEAYFDSGRDAYAYESEGTGAYDLRRESLIGHESLVLWGEGDEVQVTTEKEPVRFIFLSGRPIRESVAWYGPIVMNTQEELRTAFEEYEQGTFLKHRKEK